MTSQSPFGLLTDWDLDFLVRDVAIAAMSQSPFGLLTDWDVDGEFVVGRLLRPGLNRLSAC